MQQLRSSARVRASLGLVAFVVAGCVAPKADVTAVLPAASQDAARMKRVAVLPFATHNGADVTGDVETLLASIVVDDKRYFDVVERQRLNALARELKLAESGALDVKTASRLGKMLAANGIYLGRISRSDWSDQRYMEPRQVCVQREQKRDKRGNMTEGACLRWQNMQAHCVTRTASFEFAPRLVSVETGSIVYSRSHAGEAKSVACSEPGGQGAQALTDAQTLLSNARGMALASFRRDVAPSLEARKIDLLDSDERISANGKERFNSALAFARARRMDRACKDWEELNATESQSPDLVFNLGVCAEADGRIDQAYRHYMAADALLKAPNKTVSSALTRVRHDLQNRGKVENQLRR